MTISALAGDDSMSGQSKGEYARWQQSQRRQGHSADVIVGSYRGQRNPNHSGRVILADGSEYAAKPADGKQFTSLEIAIILSAQADDTLATDHSDERLSWHNPRTGITLIVARS